MKIENEKPYSFSDPITTNEWLDNFFKTPKGRRMYAIAFEMNTDEMERKLKKSWRNGYKEIEKVLKKCGFIRQQQTLYIGEKPNCVEDCNIATQNLVESLEWFSACVKDIRMVRLGKNNDLKRTVRNTQRMLEERDRRAEERVRKEIKSEQLERRK